MFREPRQRGKGRTVNVFGVCREFVRIIRIIHLLSQEARVAAVEEEVKPVGMAVWVRVRG